MTRIQLNHHNEQMEAYRRDFQGYWEPIRLRLKAIGKTDKELALEEMQMWRNWLRPTTRRLTRLEIQFLVGICTQAECYENASDEIKQLIQENVGEAIAMGIPVTSIILRKVQLA